MNYLDPPLRHPRAPMALRGSHHLAKSADFEIVPNLVATRAAKRIAAALWVPDVAAMDAEWRMVAGWMVVVDQMVVAQKMMVVGWMVVVD
jgi:hypothetical protein